MPTKYSDYTLDDEPKCPQCQGSEIGVFVSEYYCFRCGHLFGSFTSHSKGHTSFSLADFLMKKSSSLLGKNKKVIETTGDVIPVKVYTNNVLPFKLKPKKVATHNSAHGELSGILPDDYEECKDCGYDHIHDLSPAKRWHEAHPECSAMLTQDDLEVEM